MKKNAICQMYYFSLICHVFMLLCGILGSVFMIIYVRHFLMQGEPGLVVFCIIMIMMFLFLIALSIKTLTLLIKDHTFLINKEYITVSGKVIGFERNRDPESGVQINDRAIIKVLDSPDTEHTGNQIVLHVNDKISIGETYVFRYLKHSKIAEISQIK